MTVPSEVKRTQYAGAGSTGPYTIGFPILDSSHLKATRTIVSSGVDTELTLDAGTDGFTIDTDLSEITLTEALAVGERLTIERDIPLTQGTDYIANSAFPAEVNERALDKLTMIAQQISDAGNRSPKFKSTLPESLIGSINEAPADGATLQWDGTTGDIINGPSALDITASATAAASSATDAQSAQTAAESAQAAAETAQTNAETAETGAEAAQAAAEAAAESVNLPVLGAAHTVLHVNSAGDDLEYGKVDVNNITSDAATDGQVLTADGSGGVSFEDTGGGLQNNGYRDDYYYYAFGRTNSSAMVAVAGRLYTAPFLISEDETFTRIGIDVEGADTGNARLGIYNFANGVATTLVADLGTVSTSTTGNKEISISQSLTAGLYAIAVITDAAPSLRRGGVTAGMSQYVTGAANETASTTGAYETRSYGALPASFTYSGDVTTSTEPLIWLRKV